MDDESPVDLPPGTPEVVPRRRGRWGLAWRIGRIVLLAIVGVVLVLAGLQDRIIFPGHATQGRPESEVRPPPGTDLVRLKTAGGEPIVALFGPALEADGRPRADAKERPSLIYFYGNAMCLRDALAEFDAFRRLGANVLIPDYLGYGMSGGSPGEAACAATADAAYEHLRSRTDVDPERIVAAGWSLGGAVAADLASREPVAGLILLSTFTRAADMARRIVPLIPLGPLLRHRFDTLSKLPGIACPILIGHGRRDAIVPFAMADCLAEAARSPVTRIVVDRADHNDFFEVGGRELRDAVGAFLEEVPARTPPPEAQPGST